MLCFSFSKSRASAATKGIILKEIIRNQNFDFCDNYLKFGKDGGKVGSL